MGARPHDSTRRHRLWITEPDWLGTHKVTIGGFRRFVDETKHKNGCRAG